MQEILRKTKVSYTEKKVLHFKEIIVKIIVIKKKALYLTESFFT